MKYIVAFVGGAALTFACQQAFGVATGNIVGLPISVCWGFVVARLTRV